MHHIQRYLYIVFILVCLLAMGNIPTVYAELDRHQGVQVGEWLSPQETDKTGVFRELQHGQIAQALAVKIFTRNPGESVTVKLILEFVDQPEQMFQQTVQDGGILDLAPNEEKGIILKLTEKPVSQVIRYIVSVSDESGFAPIVKVFENPPDSSILTEQFGQAVVQQLETVQALSRSRASLQLSGIRPIMKFCTLVVANHRGKLLNSFTRKNSVAYPVLLPDDQLVFVEWENRRPVLKVIPDLLREDAEYFGKEKFYGTELFLTPDNAAVIFRRDTNIMMTDFTGNEVITLVDDLEVEEILGMFLDNSPKTYNVVFTVPKNGVKGVVDLQIAKIRRNRVLSIDLLPYDSFWLNLAQIKTHGRRIAYERFQDSQWGIYLQISGEDEGIRVSHQQFHARYPAWNADGSRLVYVSE